MACVVSASTGFFFLLREGRGTRLGRGSASRVVRGELPSWCNSAIMEARGKMLPRGSLTPPTFGACPVWFFRIKAKGNTHAHRGHLFCFVLFVFAQSGFVSFLPARLSTAAGMCPNGRRRRVGERGRKRRLRRLEGCREGAILAPPFGTVVRLRPA